LGRLESVWGKRNRAAVNRAGTIGAIEDLYILPEMRNRGFATKLLQAGLYWLQCQHAGEARAAIWARNRLSLDFFQEAGFALKWTIVNRTLRLQ
jgi:GNAT superfamily N-acetyltransferase